MQEFVPYRDTLKTIQSSYRRPFITDELFNWYFFFLSWANTGWMREKTISWNWSRITFTFITAMKPNIIACIFNFLRDICQNIMIWNEFHHSRSGLVTCETFNYKMVIYTKFLAYCVIVFPYLFWRISENTGISTGTWKIMFRFPDSLGRHLDSFSI